MIYEVSGDILLSKAQMIAHGVAANDPMTQGLALSLREQYPVMHKDYRNWCHQFHPKPGSAWMWGGVGGVRVACLLTQEGGYGQGGRPEKANLKNVRDSLKELLRIIEEEEITSLAIPKLATGVGALEWDDVFPIIKERLGDLDIPVYVYSLYQAGVQAEEKGL